MKRMGFLMLNDSFKRLLELVAVNGKIEGRKRFQKLVYILKQKGFDFTEKYTYHYYGTYSATLQMEIDYLVDSGLLREEQVGETYEYTLSEEYHELEGIFDHHKDLIKILNDKPARILELISVFFYLEDKGYKDVDIIKKKTAILKPELRDDIERAFKEYLKIKNYSIN